MTAVALVASAVWAALAVAAAAGELPTLRRPRRPARAGRLRRLLVAAGVRVPPAAVVATCAGAGVAVVAVVGSVTPIGALAVVPAGLAAATPVVVLRRRAAQRTREIRRAWPDALAQVSGTVRGGRPLSHALIDVSLNGPPALREPLAGLAARIQTVGLVPALHAVRDAVAEPVTDRVVEVLVLAHTEGGRIAIEVIDDMTVGVAEEVAAAEEVETLALEGRINARVVFALPWVVLVLLTAREGPFQVFYASPAGAVVIVVGAIVSLVGLAVVSRLSAMPEEPRVLLVEEQP